MATINANFKKLAAGYLFPEVARRAKAFAEKNPGTEVLKLGIGDTTEPLPPSIIAGLRKGVEMLADVKTYRGYGAEQGDIRLRMAISDLYARRTVNIDPSEIFVSDGAKCDAANIQLIFGPRNKIAVQDPAYPVYVDSNVIAGRTGEAEGTTYRGIYYMPCNQQNGFFPSVPTKKVDLIYLCSPNNPTGAAATHKQLKAFVDYALENRAVIIFDAAYQSYISDSSLPRTIYELHGARECAIEINSLSKSSGFTGVRAGWSVVPKALVVKRTAPGEINSLWKRRQTTEFNGASCISQEGGIAALGAVGMSESQQTIDHYMGNARIIKAGLAGMGFTVFGGDNAPYLWVKTLNNMTSWDFFDKMLSEAHVVTTPGSGFGPSGEGYFRISAFGHRENVIKAIESIKTKLRV